MRTPGRHLAPFRHGGLVVLCQIVPVGEMRGRGLGPRSSNVARKNASFGERVAAPRRFGRFHRRRDQQSPPVRFADIGASIWVDAAGGLRRRFTLFACRASSKCSAAGALARASGQKPAGPANICERRDSCGRRETARAGPSPEQLTELLRLRRVKLRSFGAERVDDANGERVLVLDGFVEVFQKEWLI